MAYKIPEVPSPQAYKEEMADCWEIQAILHPGRYVASIHISRIIATGLDEIDHEGIESEDDRLDSRLDEVLSELQRRPGFSSGKYPFSFEKYSLKLNEGDSLNKNIYLFLLLCTRFNMTKNKVHNTIDGTQLFEELCAEIVINYFGDNSESFLFGTANPGNFRAKIEELITKAGEGSAFKNPNNNQPTKNDDAVDIVAWKDFSDKRAGKLMAFGQCKTGTSWQDDIHRLKPGDFCDNWFHDSPILAPLPLVFICDTLNEDFNFVSRQKGYLFFNRFRILELVRESLNNEIQTKIQSWLDSAISTIKQNM